MPTLTQTYVDLDIQERVKYLWWFQALTTSDRSRFLSL